MICLAAGAVTATLAFSQFTLAWVHSIEKIRWEEDWHVAGATLVLDDARILGSGAGMEPPANAWLDHGVYHYRPPLPPQQALRLTHSPYTAGYELCARGGCAPLAQYLPGIENITVIELRPCPSSP